MRSRNSSWAVLVHQGRPHHLRWTTRIAVATEGGGRNAAGSSRRASRNAYLRRHGCARRPVRSARASRTARCQGTTRSARRSAVAGSSSSRPSVAMTRLNGGFATTRYGRRGGWNDARSRLDHPYGRRACEPAAQQRGEPRVALDGHDASACGGERPGQGAGAGAQVEDEVPCADACGRHQVSCDPGMQDVQARRVRPVLPSPGRVLPSPGHGRPASSRHPSMLLCVGELPTVRRTSHSPHAVFRTAACTTRRGRKLSTVTLGDRDTRIDESRGGRRSPIARCERSAARRASPATG